MLQPRCTQYLLLALPLALATIACSGEDGAGTVPGGGGESSGADSSTGGSSEDGSSNDVSAGEDRPVLDESCIDGQTTMAADGCNTCSCSAGVWACTRMACIDPVACSEGDTKPAADGCNTCSCAGGAWACTERACLGDDGTGCGGWLGDTCSDTEYCAYVEGEYCGAADASSTCQPRPSMCLAVYDPVCGCDGQTYSSGCDANGAGTGVLHSGQCSD